MTAATGTAPAKAETPPREPTRIVAFGDSLTAGYGLSAADSFPQQLQLYLRGHGAAVDVLNAGVSGDTSADGRRRLDWVLADRPHWVILCLGANDGLRGLDPVVMRANLDAILTRLNGAGVRVLLAGMLAPANFGRDYGARFAAVFPEVAARHRVPLYPFFLDGVATNPALNLEDGLHPNRAGVAVMVERIGPLVLRLIRDGG